MRSLKNCKYVNKMNIVSNIELMSAHFHALSDPIRLKVIERLINREIYVSDLCDSLNFKQP